MLLLHGIKEGRSGETSVFLWRGRSGEGSCRLPVLKTMKKQKITQFLLYDSCWPSPPAPAGVPAELGWPHDGNVAPQGCVSSSAGWSRLLLELRLSDSGFSTRGAGNFTSPPETCRFFFGWCFALIKTRQIFNPLNHILTGWESNPKLPHWMD